jgi:hypothetical protein
MTDGDTSEDCPVPRVWVDWDQRDPAGRVWTFAGDSDQPERLRPGVVVDAAPRDDVRPAVVVDVLKEPWRTVVLLQEVSSRADGTR